MTAARIEIDPIPAETLAVPIVGTAPLIVHRFSEKARAMMEEQGAGRKRPKGKRDPQAEFEDALYRLKDGGYGFPAGAFKQATVGAARFYQNLPMTTVKQAVFVRGELGTDGRMMARLTGDEPRMREDVTRLNGRTAHIKYRPEFVEWGAILEVTYVDSLLTRESLLSLIDAGGMGVGVGEWRPERDGEFGTFRVDPTRDVEVLK